MRNFKQRIRAAAWGWGAIVLLAGCGSRAAPAPKPLTSPQFPPVVKPGEDGKPPVVQPVAQAPVAPPKVDPAPQTPPKRPLTAHERALAEADPATVFEVEGTASEFAVASYEEVAAVDRFEIPPDALPNSGELIFNGAEAPADDGPQVLKSPSLDVVPRRSKVPLPAGFRESPGTEVAESGWPLRLVCEITGNEMALVTAGATTVGSDSGPDETRPAFEPFLDAFYMDVTEVTLAQYDKFREEIKEKAKDKKASRVAAAVNEGSDPRMPALGLPWGNALAFARWAGKELPTEAEWEKAVRGPEGFRAPWGNSRAVWPKLRTTDDIDRVGSFPADCSVYGICDLAGNAREWCADWFSETAHQEARAATGRTARNWAGPKKPSVSGQHVVKGNGPDWSAWHRHGRVASDKGNDIGFRCVLRLKGGSTPSKDGDTD